MICVVQTVKVKVRGFSRTTATKQNRLCQVFQVAQRPVCVHYNFYVNRESRGTTPKGEGFDKYRKKNISFFLAQNKELVLM